MANALYTNYRAIAAGGGTLGPIAPASDTIKVVLVDNADYTFSAAHTNYSQLTAGGRVSTATLASVTVGVVATGAVDSADPTFSSVSGDQSESLVLFKDTGVESSSPLIAYFDTFSAGMPVTPNGGSITVVVDTYWYAF